MKRHGTPLLDTQREALHGIEPARGRLQSAVLAFLRNRGAKGATDAELAAELELQLDTARARRCELRDAGDVADSGRRRATHSGRGAVVWVASQMPTDGGPPRARPRHCVHALHYPGGTWTERQRGEETVVECSVCGKYFGHLRDISREMACE
jgi:hypothetical protein